MARNKKDQDGERGNRRPRLNPNRSHKAECLPTEWMLVTRRMFDTSCQTGAATHPDLICVGTPPGLDDIADSGGVWSCGKLRNMTPAERRPRRGCVIHLPGVRCGGFFQFVNIVAGISRANTDPDRQYRAELCALFDSSREQKRPFKIKQFNGK